MQSPGAPSPRRAGLTAYVTQIGASFRGRQSFARDTKIARQVFGKELGLKPGASLQELVDAVARYRDRPLTIEERSLDAPFTGLCLRGRSGDRIIVGNDDSEWHRIRVKAHELAHLLPWNSAADDTYAVTGHGHGLNVVLDEQDFADQLSTLPGDLVDDVLTGPVKLRAHFDTPEERAAEALATALPWLLGWDGASNPTGAITSSFSSSISSRRFR
jgi:hypothetical protein